jgi:hypothetical protein
MTTTVYAFSSYVMQGTTLQMILRDIATGGETIVEPDIAAHVVHIHHVWDGHELVFREVKREAAQRPTVAELEALLESNDGRKVSINPDGTIRSV